MYGIRILSTRDESGRLGLLAVVAICVFLALTAQASFAASRYLYLYAPGDGWTLNSPIRVSARGDATSYMSDMQVYVDGKLAYTGREWDASLDVSLKLSPGTHRVTVTVRYNNETTVSRSVNVKIRPARYSRFGYAVASDGTISGYALHGSTGILHHNGYSYSPPTWDPSHALAVGRFLYRSNGEDGTISGYSIGADGRLSEIPGSPFYCGSRCRGMASHPRLGVLYSADSSGSIQVFEINSATGALSQIASSPSASGSSSLTVDPYGRYLFVTNSGEDSVTRMALDAQGVPSAGMKSPTGSNPIAIGIDSLRKYVVVANANSNSLSVFSLESGLPVLDSPFAAGPNPQALAIAPSGAFVYVANAGDNTVSVHTLNFRTGSLWRKSTHPVCERPTAVAVDAEGDRVYVACAGWPMEVWSFEADAKGVLTRVIEKTRTRGPAVAFALSTGNARVSEISKFLYAGVFTDRPRSGRVLVHRIESDGRLTRTSNAPLTAPAGVLSLGLHPSNRFLYAPGQRAETTYGVVQVFAVNSASGALTSGQLLQEIAPLDPRVMLVDPSGRFAYAPSAGNVEPTLFGWEIDQNTGSLGDYLWYEYSQTSDWAEIDPTGKFMLLNELNSMPFVIGLDPATGGQALWSDFLLPPAHYQQISVNPSGRLAVAITPDHICSFRMNGTTGELTQVNSLALSGVDPYAFAIEPLGRFVYVLNRGSSDISAFRMNRQTGTLAAVGTANTPTGPHPVALAIENSGRYLYVANGGSKNISIFRINGETGTLAPAYPAVQTGIAGTLTSIRILTTVQ